MKILLVHNQYREQGGEEQAVQRLQNELQAKGHAVVQFGRSSRDWAKESLIGKIRLMLEIPYSWSFYNAMIRKIKDENPNVIHVHNIFPFISPSVYAAAQRMKVPVVQTLHNYRFFCLNGLFFRNNKPCELCIKGNVLNGIFRGCYQKSFFKSLLIGFTLALHRFLNTWNTKIGHFIALNQFSRNKFIEAGLDKNKITVIPNGIHIPGDNVSTSTAASLIYIGRLSQEKGVKTLLKAFRAFSERNPGCHLDLVGDGPLREWAESYVTEGPRLDITLHGHCEGEKKQALLKKASFLVCPSECYETGPYVVMESMAAGVPVLGSRIGGVQELVEDGKNGWLFEPANVSSLHQTLQKAFKNINLRPQFQKAGKEKMTQKYASSNSLSSILSVYPHA